MSDEAMPFDGSIPALYDRHLGPLIFEPYARDLARRVAELRPTRVLEIACGTGRVTRQLDAMLPPQTAIIATDLSDSMLDFARETVNASSRVTWQQADGMALGFDDGAFDVVVCQFGLMFFPDKAAGLRELGRVIAPGGRLLLSTWDSRDVNRFAHVLSERVTAFFPQEPPQFMAVPWHLHDRVALHAMTLDAGFRHAEVEALPADAEGPSAADAARGFVRGNPLAMQLQDRGANMDAIEQSVADGLAELGGTSPLRFAMQALLLHAHR